MNPSNSFASKNIWEMLVIPPEFQNPERLVLRVFQSNPFALVLKKGDSTPPGFKTPHEIRLVNFFTGLFPQDMSKLSSQRMCMLADAQRAEIFTEMVKRDFAPGGWNSVTQSLLAHLEKGVPGTVGIFQGEGASLYSSFSTCHVLC